MSNSPEITESFTGTLPVTENNGLSQTQVKIKERYIIDFSEPIESLNMNGAKAYKATDIIDKDKLLFALICSPETSPRHSILPYIKSFSTKMQPFSFFVAKKKIFHLIKKDYR